MYNDPADKYILGTDRRLVDWLVEFVRLFSADKKEYEKLAGEIAESKSYDEKKKLALTAGLFKLENVISHIVHSVLDESSFTYPIGLVKAVLERLYRYDISNDMKSVLATSEFDVWLNEEAIRLYVKFDCVDNAILGLHHVLAKFQKSICHIAVMDRSGNEFGGTGFVIHEKREDGTTMPLVITNRHVVDPDHWELRSIQSAGRELTLGNVMVSGQHDLAAIEITDDAFEHAFQIYPETHILEHIVTVGYPFIARVAHPVLMAHAGQINGFSETIDRERLMFISAAVAPGASGGPVLNELGLVVGVTTQSQEGEYITGGSNDGSGTSDSSESQISVRSIHHAAIPAMCVLEFLSNARPEGAWGD